jgi:misacylated tRNA(Ala) deacylase
VTTRLLFRDDAYLREAPAQVVAYTSEGGVILDQSLFYATSGGQPGDSGHLVWDGGIIPIATAVKADGGQIALVAADAMGMPPIGAPVRQVLDWDRRYRHMRMHTALHLLSVVIPLPVTGGQIGADKSRLDFDMPDPLTDIDRLNDALSALIDRDLAVTDSWITDDELQANPGLVKTLRVAPPMGQGQVRLVRIGQGQGQVDLQPCGGTHVARTAEIGHVEIGKIEKKGRENRRVSLLLVD